MTNNQTWLPLIKKLQSSGFPEDKITQIVDGLDGMVKAEYVIRLIENLPSDKQVILKSLIASQDEITRQKTIEQFLKQEYDEKQLSATMESSVKRIVSDYLSFMNQSISDSQ